MKLRAAAPGQIFRAAEAEIDRFATDSGFRYSDKHAGLHYGKSLPRLVWCSAVPAGDLTISLRLCREDHGFSVCFRGVLMLNAESSGPNRLLVSDDGPLPRGTRLDVRIDCMLDGSEDLRGCLEWLADQGRFLKERA